MFRAALAAVSDVGGDAEVRGRHVGRGAPRGLDHASEPSTI